MSNTVGSQEIISPVLLSKKNQKLVLTQSELSVLIGSILGDGYITKLGRIQIEQGKKQKEYLLWKYKMLKNMANTSILLAQRIKANSVKTTSYRFWTKQYFHSWRNTFYPFGVKIIPEGIEKVLTPLALAVWYMDDGFLRKPDSVAIATENFTRDDLIRLTDALVSCYDIQMNTVSRGRLYLGKKATQKFVKIISPFIISSMRYKLP